MAIIYQPESGVFKLSTKNTDYIFWAAGNKRVYHLYYGKSVQDTSVFTDLFSQFYPASFSPMPPESDLAYSPDYMMQEFSGSNIGDYRICSAGIKDNNGARAANVYYAGHKIRKGKAQLQMMPSAFDAGEQSVETLELILKDPGMNVEYTLMYSVFPESDVIVRSVKVQNYTDHNIYVERLMSAQVDFDHHRFDWITLNGSWMRERNMSRVPLHYGIQEIRSVRGSSGHCNNPVFALAEHNATEHAGMVYGFMLAYSGNHACQVEVEQYGGTRTVLGINSESFEWKLIPNDTFQTPEVILTCSADGLTGMSHNYHDFMRKHWLRPRWALTKRPILINNWEATYFNFDDKKILSIAQAASELGVEMLVLDDGWFGKRDNDCNSLGDWFVNTQKIGDLPELVKNINALGLKFGLWFEPEMISEDSELYRAHPDWVLEIPGRAHTLGRNQMVLDMSRKDVVDELYNMISNILRSANIEYIKWDMNRNLTEIYSKNLPPDQQGEVAHRYTLGVYRLHERLLKEFPDLLIEGCSGGGGRFDAGMLYYCPQIWCSDDTDAIERLNIQRGTALFYPASTMGAHVSVVPNHGTGRITPFDTRGNVAFMGSSGYELDLTQLSGEDRQKVRQQTAEFRQYHHLVLEGDFYRLTDAFDPAENVAAWSFVAKDRKSALFFAVQRKSVPHKPAERIRFAGLEKGIQYSVKAGDKEQFLYGDTLMYAGYPLNELQNRDGASIFVVLTAVE